jgi:hypothetical protein
MTSGEIQALSGERKDILETLGLARHWLRNTARDLTEEQARQRSTASELTIGGLIKHVTFVENGWAEFAVVGAKAMPDFTNLTEADMAAWADGFKLLPEETLAGVLAEYDQVAKHTDELVATLPDFDASHELAPSPWQPPGQRRTVRAVFLHIAAETFQHAGHADIIRESIDGSKSMG